MIANPQHACDYLNLLDFNDTPAFVQRILYLFLNLFLILAYLSNNFLLYGSMQLLFLFLKMAAVPLLTITDLYNS
jgi:hypothetical protein